MNPLPPLHSLRAFEAAGRLQSIRRAAEELNVTPGAVSRQVQGLEAFLGVKLFRRNPREISLTPEGTRYLQSVSQSLDLLREATQFLTGRREMEVVRVRAYTTFAMKWLIPRLASFQGKNPDVEVRLETSIESVDFDKESVDCAIRLGDGGWGDVETDRVVSNILVPLCSPKLIDDGLSRPEDLGHFRLLHSMIRPDDWRYWLVAAGVKEVDPYAGDKFASSTLAYQAALEGYGIMMAQKALFSDDIRLGKLVVPFPFELDLKGFTYHLVYPHNRLRKPAFRRFRGWLLDEAQMND